MRQMRSPRVVLAISLIVVSGCASGDASRPRSEGDAAGPTTSATSGSAPTAGAVGSALDGLSIRPAGSTVADYRRAAFGDDWDYDPATGCNVRERVLIEESLQDPKPDDRCRSTTGRWRSRYDGVVTSDPADLQIDHLVPLADAWRSGADAWTDDQRRRFANDLSSADTLIAVTGSTNQSKGDSTPDEWMPPDRGGWCDYARAWVGVKARWDLSVTAAEKATLVSILDGCDLAEPAGGSEPEGT